MSDINSKNSPYWLGYKAGRFGVTPSGNPYPVGTPEGSEWEAGRVEGRISAKEDCRD